MRNAINRFADKICSARMRNIIDDRKASRLIGFCVNIERGADYREEFKEHFGKDFIDENSAIYFLDNFKI